MKQIWSTDELGEHWTISTDEISLLKGRTNVGRLAVAMQLKYYQSFAAFPGATTQVSPDVIEYIADQIEVPANGLVNYGWEDRTGRQHRQEILRFLGVRTFDDAAETALRIWLINDVLPASPSSTELAECVTEWLLSNRVERTNSYLINRVIASAGREHEDQLFAVINGKLDKQTCNRLDALLIGDDGATTFGRLRSDTGAVGLEGVLREVAKLSDLREISLPDGVLDGLNHELVKTYRQRAARESAWELKRHPKQIRYPLLAFYCIAREAEIIDGLVDLLIQVVHQIGARAERNVTKELINDFVKVNGKANILFRIAEAVHDEPDGTVRDVVYPVASETTIADLVKEFRSNGPEYKVRVHTKMRSSYSTHYRKMLPRILAALEFRSNNTAHRPILDAIEIIKDQQGDRRQFFAADAVPIDGVVRNKWRDVVIETAPDGTARINRINYEIAVVQALRERLRCKEIWAVGADRYRNPDEDLPGDFNSRRPEYYGKLSLPTDATAFVADLKAGMAEALNSLNASLPHNPKVRIKQRGGKHHISITPFDALPDPPNLDKLKAEIGRRWPATSLLDILKETDLRIGFSQAFRTSASREVTDVNEVQRRLLLMLYGLGTNAGLKRIASGRHGVSYKELLHIRRRYIDKVSMRDAIRRVVNAIMDVRAPEVWGEGTTACASDSTKFGAWDQNLMTEWHARYGGRGVMIYWHVDKQSTCIYSQLKRCSSSEVAAMIEGVLHHGTDAEVEQQYVDSHGQSEVAFAFCHLLGFSLMPRLKGIAKQKLYLPETGSREALGNLEAILTRAIDWDLIAQQYDEMVKFTTALRERTAEPEAILRRFTRSNVKHPTYKALAELGKATKTMFLCDYLASEDMRREINDGLNVVERWNGTNDFIFFGKGGEVATNRLEDQEMAALALHLLQTSLVYVNTLMLQDVLAEPSWRLRMTERDMAALTPLVHAHVNPYGIFELDMKQRLPLDQMSEAA